MIIDGGIISNHSRPIFNHEEQVEGLFLRDCLSKSATVSLLQRSSPPPLTRFMKDRYLLTVLLLGFLGTCGFGQDSIDTGPKDWRAISVVQHQKGKWLAGAGPTFFGATAKAGRFVANRTWVGVEGEAHALLSDRLEAGVFARYYLLHGGRISSFSEAGVSYGRFQGWSFDIDNEFPDPELYRSVKLNAALGLECSLSRRVSLEGVAKVGRLVKANWFQPSFQGSVNVYLGR